MTYVHRRPLALAAVLCPALAFAFGCGRVPGQFEILNDQIPNPGTCTIPVNPTAYQGQGTLDVSIVRSDLPTAYFFFPLLENNLPHPTGTLDANQIQITGFDVDIAGEVARDIFGNPSQVEYRILSSDERVTALQKSEVDIVVKTMTITCDRRKLVNFSTVYLDASQRILASRDSPVTKPADLSGKRVCVAKGTTSLHRIREISPPPIVVEVVNWADCLVTLQQRQVDAVSTDDSILAGLVSQDPYLHIVGPNMGTQPYGIGVKLENTGLVRFVNGTLERVRRDGTWNALYRKWLTVLGIAPVPPSPRYED